MSSSQLDRITLGKLGESYAAAYLEQQGYLLVAANFTIPVGRNRRDAVVTAEIDIVAYDDSCLCFVEVKTRTSDDFLPPQVNVDLRKRRQISRAARAYRHMFALESEPSRYDVVTVVMKETTPEVELFKDFWRDHPRKPRSNFFYDQ